jgi:NADPH:quinone reductase-like Zn-dependent oxidoreductase
VECAQRHQPRSPGNTVLVQGSGGVSVFALQLARAAGPRVFATSGSDAKARRLRELGAEFVVNYRTEPNWAQAVLDYTGGEGVDHVVEVGGAGTFAQSLRAVRMAGTVSVIGVLSGVEIGVSIVPFLHKHLSVNGIFVGSRTMLEEMLRSNVKPAVDRTFAFPDAIAAYRYLESGEHFGKVILESVQ